MSLNQMQKNRLSELDARSGGLIEAESKTQVGNRKSLIIGLGGMGGRVISRVKTELTRRVNYNDTQIRLLAIDSDLGDLNRLESDSPGRVHLDPKTETFQIYFDNADQVLINEDARPAFYKKWLNKNFACRLDGHGAGQVRQAGRALFLGMNFVQLKHRIRSAIKGLCGEGVLQNLDVYIVAGIAGGTGSGSVIDMPNIVRQVFQENGGDLGHLKISGYILLPSVMYGIDGITDIDKIGFKSNGYAALKELDYYMSVPYRCGNNNLYQELFEYPTGEVVVLEQLNSLYNLCTLISGSVGGNIVRDVDSYAVDVTSESVINMLIDTQKEEVANDGQRQMASFHIGKSFLDNVDRKSAILDEGPPEDPVFAREACYKYCTSGVGTASIPNGSMMGYAGASIFTNLLNVNMQRRRVVPVDDVRTFVRNSLIPPVQMFNTITNDRDYQIIIDEGVKPTYKDVGSSNTRDFELFIEQSKQRLANTRSRLVSDALGRAVSNFNTQCYNYLLNFGPYSLVQIFEMYREKNNDTTCEGVLQTVRGFKASLDMIISDLENKKAANAEKLNKLTKDATKAGAIRVGVKFMHRKDLNGYIDSSIEDARYTLRIEAARRLQQEITLYVEHVINYINDCKVLADVLDETERVLRSSAERFMQASNATLRYNLNLVDPQENAIMFEWVRAKVDTAVGTVNMTKLQQDLINDFISHRKDWVSANHEFMADQKIRLLINQAFTMPVKVTVEDYFAEKMRREGIDGVKKEVQTICEAVSNLAQPLYGFISNYPSLARAISNKYIIVPDGISGPIKAEFMAYAEQENMQLVFSKAAGQIAIYNLIAGIPLYADRFMPDYETTYVSRNATWQHINERLSDEENLSWRNYPPVISSSIYRALPGGYDNPAERAFLENIFTPLMEKAMESGVFVYQNGQWYARTIAEELAFAESYANNLCRNHPNPNQTIPVGETMLTGLLEKASTKYTLPVTLHKAGLENFIGDRGQEFRDICKIVRMHVPLYLKIKDTMKLFECAERIINRFNEVILHKSAVKDFLNVVGSGRIYRDENNYWRISFGATDNEVLFDVDGAKYLDSARLAQDDLVYYSVFKGFMGIDAEKNSRIVALATEYVRNRDKEFSVRRAPFIEAANNFSNCYEGAINAMEKEALEREIGSADCNLASMFYEQCRKIGA